MPHTGPKRCPHCGFTKVELHVQRVRKVRGLDLLGKSSFY
ncbi:transposase family protein [Caenibacillus caldisaponilyticus]